MNWDIEPNIRNKINQNNRLSSRGTRKSQRILLIILRICSVSINRLHDIAKSEMQMLKIC